MPLVTRESLTTLLNDNNPAKVQAVVGRALVVLLKNQTADEQVMNATTQDNGIGFTGADARAGSITAKYWIKNQQFADFIMIKGGQMKTCKCSNNGILSTFKFCPYCGGKFVVPPKRYRYEGMMSSTIKGSYAINTGVKRPPKKGEYYLSGATPMAYKAPNDLGQAYLIAEIIKPN